MDLRNSGIAYRILPLDVLSVPWEHHIVLAELSQILMELFELKDFLFINRCERHTPSILVEHVLIVIALFDKDCTPTVQLPFEVADDHFQSLSVCLVRMSVDVVSC